MKICIIGPAHPLRGGIAAFNERLCSTFNSLGHPCLIISYSLQYPDFLFPGKTQYDDGPGPENIEIHTLLNSINPMSWYKVSRFISLEKPDLIIYRFWIPFMGPALGTIDRLLKKEKIKTLALVDNLIPHEKRAGDTVLTKYFMKNIQKYLVMSEEVERDVKKLKAEAKVLLQRHPIYNHYGNVVSREEAREYLRLPHDKNVILFFGLIRKYKGLDLLLEAFARSRSRENSIIVIAGECYDKKSDYDELAEKLGIAQRIFWFDNYIPNEEVRYFFSACNVLALPYRSATQSGVTQVAFHFETPVIVTDVGGLSEIIQHDINGLVSAPDPVSLVKNLDYYFENEKETAFRQGMKIEKAKYNWDTFAQNLISFALKQL